MLDAVKGRRDLYLNEAMELIRQYGFSTPPYFLCRSAEEALQVWKTLNGPVAMKVVQPHISHKTDQGMIRLNLNSDEEISSTFAALCREVPHEDLEVMIQPIISEGREVMLGGRQASGAWTLVGDPQVHWLDLILELQQTRVQIFEQVHRPEGNLDIKSRTI